VKKLQEEVWAALGYKYLFPTALATGMPPAELPASSPPAKVKLKMADLQIYIRSSSFGYPTSK
jgi:hypothetical protein